MNHDCSINPGYGLTLIQGEVLMAGDLWRCGGGVASDNPGMEKSKLRIVLRFCLVALFALIVLSIGLAFVAEKLLPETLAEWNRADSAGEFEFTDLLTLLFWGAGVFLFLVSMGGLFCYQRWAAWMMLAVLVVFSVQLLFSPTVEPGILSYLGSLSDILTGLVLGLAFFTDALEA
jgi:hypothetical protein